MFNFDADVKGNGFTSPTRESLGAPCTPVIFAHESGAVALIRTQKTDDVQAIYTSLLQT